MRGLHTQGVVGCSFNLGNFKPQVTFYLKPQVIFYEIPSNERSSAWRSAANCKGTIRLGCAPGSVATVEALVTPHSAGPLHAPQLHLRGIVIQASGDCLDDGSSTYRIMVSV